MSGKFTKKRPNGKTGGKKSIKKRQEVPKMKEKRKKIDEKKDSKFQEDENSGKYSKYDGKIQSEKSGKLKKVIIARRKD